MRLAFELVDLVRQKVRRSSTPWVGIMYTAAGLKRNKEAEEGRICPRLMAGATLQSSALRLEHHVFQVFSLHMAASGSSQSLSSQEPILYKEVLYINTCNYMHIKYKCICIYAYITHAHTCIYTYINSFCFSGEF
jgi:hypothetical protein